MNEDEYLAMLAAHGDQMPAEEQQVQQTEGMYSESSLGETAPKYKGGGLAGYDDYLKLKKRFGMSKKEGIKIETPELPKPELRVGQLVNTVDYPRYLSGDDQ